jgi:hypothetical protein
LKPPVFFAKVRNDKPISTFTAEKAMNDNSNDINMDSSTLYREELITDQQTGSIRRLIPIDIQGERDENRPILYQGQVQMLTPAGPLPIGFDIEAETLEQAVKNFGDAARKGAEETIKELEKARRDQASKIVVPQGGMPPNNSNIQIP